MVSERPKPGTLTEASVFISSSALLTLLSILSQSGLIDVGLTAVSGPRNSPPTELGRMFGKVVPKAEHWFDRGWAPKSEARTSGQLGTTGSHHVSLTESEREGGIATVIGIHAGVIHRVPHGVGHGRGAILRCLVVLVSASADCLLCGHLHGIVAEGRAVQVMSREAGTGCGRLRVGNIPRRRGQVREVRGRLVIRGRRKGWDARVCERLVAI